MTYTVTITRPGYGRYSGGAYITSQTFVDEKKARVQHALRLCGIDKTIEL